MDTKLTPAQKRLIFDLVSHGHEVSPFRDWSIAEDLAGSPRRQAQVRRLLTTLCNKGLIYYTYNDGWRLQPEVVIAATEAA